jgi:hypothetical protein
MENRNDNVQLIFGIKCLSMEGRHVIASYSKSLCFGKQTGTTGPFPTLAAKLKSCQQCRQVSNEVMARKVLQGDFAALMVIILYNQMVILLHFKSEVTNQWV